MARITVEDCLKRGYNKFLLVHLAAKRVIQIRKGEEPLIQSENREVVTTLREIAAGKVRLKKANSLSGPDIEIESEPPENEVDKQSGYNEDTQDKV